MVIAGPERAAGALRCGSQGAGMKVAFIGLGVMGYPMAGHLPRAGHDGVVFNRNRARAGALAGGAREREGARGVSEGYARATQRMGGRGGGQLTRMVNQICIGGVVRGVAEAQPFARRAGLDLGLVYEAISKGAAQSWQMDNRW